MGISPKAGCTVATKMFFKHMGLLDEALKFHPWVHEFRHNIFYERYGRVSREDMRDPSFFKFKVVRNPYHRVISGFFRYLDIFKEKRPPESFHDFLTRLKDTDLLTCDRHWRRQATEDAPDYYDKVIKIENFAEGVKEINQQLGTSFDSGFTSWHHLRKEGSKEFCGRLKFDATVQIKTIPDYEHFYDAEIRRLVNELYAIDFETYQYPQI